MATFKISQIIHKPVHEVFDAVIHIENFPKWNPSRNPSARRLGVGEIGEGSEFEMEIKGFGKVHQTLEEFQKDRQVKVVPHNQASWRRPSLCLHRPGRRQDKSGSQNRNDPQGNLPTHDADYVEDRQEHAWDNVSKFP